MQAKNILDLLETFHYEQQIDADRQSAWKWDNFSKMDKFDQKSGDREGSQKKIICGVRMGNGKPTNEYEIWSLLISA